MKSLFAVMKQELLRGQDLVLVSVIASSGSTPRGSGARMLIASSGLLAGTIGGGAIEYQCIRKGQQLLGSGTPVQESIVLNQHENAQLGMVCGGRVEVHFLPICGGDPDMIDLCSAAMDRIASVTPFWLLTPLSEGKPLMLWPVQNGEQGGQIPSSITDHLQPEPNIYRADSESWFCEQIQRSGVVYIFGGGHVAQALVPVLAPLDFPCIVLEDREEFAKPELFPGAQQVRLIDFEHISDDIEITPDDYVCIMTRGHENDLLVQQQVLDTPARYIGLIGSARKAAAAFGALRKMGFSERNMARIVTPIGLPIGGRSPAEIAISIAAQLIQYRAGMRRDFPFMEAAL